MVTPTLEEVKEYIRINNYNVNPEHFYNYYSSNNWCLSNGKKMKNWKKSIVTWNYNNYNNSSNNKIKQVDAMSDKERLNYYQGVKNEL